jgi:tetratricopeptide (TPR) repeat protein
MTMTRRAKLEQMLEKSPQDAFLNFGLAMELAKEGRIDEALAQFDRVLRIDPSYLTAYFQKGSTLIHAKRIPDARAVLTAGIAAARSLGDSHAMSEMQAMLNVIA